MISFHHGESISSWMETIQLPAFPPLNQDIDVDVCIVGGGIAGLTIAYQLLHSGKKVCVLEGYEIGSGQSGRTTAHFTYALDERYHKLEKIHGEKGTQFVAESHQAALKKVDEIIRREHIECDLEKINGYLFCSDESYVNYSLQSKREKCHEYLNKELEATLRAGLSDVYITEKIPFDSFDPGPALCYPNQLQLNPLKYLNGLADCILKKGGKIFTNSHVVEIKGGEAAYVRLQNNHIVTCESIVVATNTPVNDLVAIHTKQASYRSYVIGLEIPEGIMIKGLFWDSEDPYHYVRLEKKDGHHHEILLVGGEDHKTGQNDNPESSYTRLENWTRKRFPKAGRIIYKWSGHVLEPVDGLAYIGHNPLDKENVYVVTGHSGNGMTYSVIAAMLITDLILGRENHWKNIYSPSRISLGSAGNYIRENANVLAQYKDWFVEPQFDELEDVPPDEGVIFRDGLQIIAAYKDHHGNFEFNSAVCPHLGGIVHWNSSEKSWDCPCHGSSFNCHGNVIKGPANVDLSPVNRPAVNPPDTLKVWETPDATPVL
ncbi:MAG: FAD-dependent oxidoreductase [Bacteriovorax sp.]|jgi:glycine/D-amino acid oxidase-like deaminating enzyme/nitrite reductase/ring-hydroxylating ferredoxin subunit